MPAVASHLPPQPAAPGCRRLGEGVPSGAAVPCQEGGRRWQPAGFGSGFGFGEVGSEAG